MAGSPHNIGDVVARYRGQHAAADGLVSVRVGRLVVLTPSHQVHRAEALLRAMDDFGIVPARAIRRIFPGDRRAPSSVHARVALSWLGARITPT